MFKEIAACTGVFFGEALANGKDRLFSHDLSQGKQCAVPLEQVVLALIIKQYLSKETDVCIFRLLLEVVRRSGIVGRAFQLGQVESFTLAIVRSLFPIDQLLCKEARLIQDSITLLVENLEQFEGIFLV